VSLDHTKVSGDATAQSRDRSEPGTTSMSGKEEGTIDTMPSRRRLLAGPKQSGAPGRTRPRMLSGASAAKMAATVPPSE
jgi:hypothetical protein